MRALQLAELGGPDSLRPTEVSEPDGSHMLAPDGGVVIGVRAAAVSFPDVLQSRGLYQYKPDMPFVPGAEVAGIVRSAPEGAEVAAGDRVAAFTGIGGMAEVAVAPQFMTFRLLDSLDFAQGAALILNYHTAYFALKLRGRLREGERVLVHGAAGGVGTAALQVAKGLGASTIAVVSSDAKDNVAREAGADDVVRSDGPWREQVLERTGGVDVVLDPVGGAATEPALRSLAPGGRHVVVGFASGEIPRIATNLLLLRNARLVGFEIAGWQRHHAEAAHEARATLAGWLAAGRIAPYVGARFPLERTAEALRLVADRRALGKVVIEI